jgi:hypothetical protein
MTVAAASVVMVSCSDFELYRSTATDQEVSGTLEERFNEAEEIITEESGGERFEGNTTLSEEAMEKWAVSVGDLTLRLGSDLSEYGESNIGFEKTSGLTGSNQLKLPAKCAVWVNFYYYENFCGRLWLYNSSDDEAYARSSKIIGISLDTQSKDFAQGDEVSFKGIVLEKTTRAEAVEILGTNNIKEQVETGGYTVVSYRAEPNLRVTMIENHTADSIVKLDVTFEQ